MVIVTSAVSLMATIAGTIIVKLTATFAATTTGRNAASIAAIYVLFLKEKFHLSSLFFLSHLSSGMVI